MKLEILPFVVGPQIVFDPKGMPSGKTMNDPDAYIKWSSRNSLQKGKRRKFNNLQDLRNSFDEGNRFIAYVLGNNLLAFDQFRSFVEMYGYEIFSGMLKLEDAHQSEALLSLKMGEYEYTKIPAPILESLHCAVKEELEKFQEEIYSWTQLAKRKKWSKYNKVARLWWMADKYGIEIIPMKDRDDEPILVTRGKDFRGAVALFMLNHVLAYNKIPPPRLLLCLSCGEPIKGGDYAGQYYCSRECALKAGRNNEAAKFKDKIRKKGERQLEGEKLTAFKAEMKKVQSQSDVAALAMNYGINIADEKRGPKPRKQRAVSQKPKKAK